MGEGYDANRSAFSFWAWSVSSYAKNPSCLLSDEVHQFFTEEWNIVIFWQINIIFIIICMENFWEKYAKKLLELQSERLIDLSDGEDFWFWNIHKPLIGDRITELLGVNTDNIPVDLCLVPDEVLSSVCPRSDDQFHWMVDSLDISYRKGIVISINGIALWILKWFFSSEQNIHICSLASFSHEDSSWFFWWLYTPSQEFIRLIFARLNQQKTLVRQALVNKKWPLIEVSGGIKLFPRRFLKWGKPLHIIPKFYNHLYREAQLLRNAWEENILVISS